MAIQALPLFIFGGATVLVLSARKKKKKKKKAASHDRIEITPEVGPIEDLDADEPIGAEDPSTLDPSHEDSLGPADYDLDSDSPPPPTPDSYEDPPIGPTGTGSCANPIYSREPVPVVSLAASIRAKSMFPREGYYFNIRAEFQKRLFDDMLARFTAMKNEQERRTVSSVVLRETLKKYNPNCAWETPISGLGEPEQLVWDSARRLMMMAQVTAGYEDPGYSKLFQTGERLTVSRDALGDPDPGFMGAQAKPEIGRRIEILATDKNLEHAEHIIGKIERMSGPNAEPNLFEVRIVDKFQGQDVRPQLRTKHGFKAGSNAFFSQKGPTGIYRIFPSGME